MFLFDDMIEMQNSQLCWKLNCKHLGKYFNITEWYTSKFLCGKNQLSTEWLSSDFCHTTACNALYRIEPGTIHCLLASLPCSHFLKVFFSLNLCTLQTRVLSHFPLQDAHAHQKCLIRGFIHFCNKSQPIFFGSCNKFLFYRFGHVQDIELMLYLCFSHMYFIICGCLSVVSDLILKICFCTRPYQP